MADKDAGTEAAAEGGEGEGAAAPNKSKLKLLIIGAAALIVVGGAGAGTYFMFFQSHGDDKHAAAPPPKPPVFMDVPEIIVNLSGGPGDRTQYLKVKAVLEVKEQPVIAQITPMMPRVMDMFQTYIRELRPADLAGSSGLYRLREELTRRVNAAISPNHVDAVLFKEVVVQ